jgi:hypothetical protein
VRKYTQEEKAVAVEIVDRHGELNKAALDDARAALDAPTLAKSTLHSWLEPKAGKPVPANQAQYQSRPTVEDRDQASVALSDAFEALAFRLVEKASQDSVIADMKGKDMVIAAGVAVDKMRLLRGLPTEIVEVLPRIKVFFERVRVAGHDPVQVMERIIARLDDGFD